MHLAVGRRGAPWGKEAKDDGLGGSQDPQLLGKAGVGQRLLKGANADPGFAV